jgi:spermidine/putrescine transport system substrate-binding protein
MPALLSGCSKKKTANDGSALKKLFIYNWPYYISDSVIKGFEKEFGVAITYDNYSSNEELLTKLQAGASGYDLIFPSDYMVKIMIAQNMLEAIDHNNLPNLDKLESQFRNLPFDPTLKHSIPYLWGTTGIGYNAEKVTEEVKSWKILWNEKYKERISMLDDIRELAVPALKMSGYSLNSQNPKEIEAMKQLLLTQKKLVKTYTSDTYVDFLKSGDVWFAQGYSGDIFQVIKEHKTIHYVIPQEGTALWVDNMCIPKGARNKAVAEMFMNYILRPAVIAEITNFTWYANPNKEAKALVKPEIANNPTIYPPKEILDKCEFFHDLGETTKLFEQVYNELKSS